MRAGSWRRSDRPSSRAGSVPAAPHQTFVGYVGQHDRAFAEAFQLGLGGAARGAAARRAVSCPAPQAAAPERARARVLYHAIHDQGVDRRTLHGLPVALRGLLIVVNDITEQVTHAREEADRTELLAMVQGFMTDRSGFLAFFDEVTHLLESYRESGRDLVTPQAGAPHHQGQRRSGRVPRASRTCATGRRSSSPTAPRRKRPTPTRAVVGRWHTLSDTLATLLGERGRDVVEVQVGELAALIEELRGAGAPSRVTARLSTLDAGAGRAPAGTPGALRPLAGAAPGQG